MSKILMAQPRKTLKTFTFFEELLGIGVGSKSLGTNSKVIFRDAYNGYIIKRVSSFAYCFQGNNTWKFNVANPMVYDSGVPVIKEMIEGWTGYLNLYVKKDVPDSIVTIQNTTGTLLNDPYGIKLPFNKDFELNIPVADDEMVFYCTARWSVRNTNLEVTDVDFRAWINVTIEY